MDTTGSRLFFALWPDAAIVDELMVWTRLAYDVCGGRTMRPDTLHLTLAFLGRVDDDKVSALTHLLAAQPWSGGTLTLDCFGRFQGPRIVWAGPSASTPWLDALHESLWRELIPLGLSPSDEPFRPHVSLLRRAGDGDLSAIPPQRPIVWTTDRLVLAASTPSTIGSYYQILGECRVSPISEA